MREDNKNDTKNIDAHGSAHPSAGSRVLAKLDLAEGAPNGDPYIRLFGTKKLYVENHRGVLELSRSVVRIYTLSGILRITGENLNISLADRETICCEGLIKGLEYET